MKKIIPLLLIAFSLTTSGVIAQKRFLSLGGELALPNAEGLKRNAGTGVGFSLRHESLWTHHLGGMVTVGYVNFAEKKDDYFTTTIYKQYAIPIQLGLKYYISNLDKVPKGF